MNSIESVLYLAIGVAIAGLIAAYATNVVTFVDGEIEWLLE